MNIVYGFPCVENPHNFSPDVECCTEAEILAWDDARQRWDAGGRDVRKLRCESTYDDAGRLIQHVTRTSWGIGTNYMEDDIDGY